MSGAKWFGPSLLRRTVLTLLAALLLVWVVLSLKDYRAFKQDVQARESLGKLTQTVLDSLQGFDAVQARAALLAADRQFNALRRQNEPQAPGALLFQLSQADGTRVYRSAAPADLPDLLQPLDAAQVEHQGQRYWPVLQHNAQWRLAVWVPVMTDGAALRLIGLDVLGYVLLALPFVLLPMVLAVWQGLRPLRRLAQRTAQRPQGDLSPLQEPTGYAELAPLVDAFNALLERARLQREREQAFVQDAAHELKTPLAVVAAQAHVLASAHSPEQRHAALAALEQGVQRASHQVNQLLTLAALEQPAPDAPQRIDLVEAVRDLLIELEPLARRRGTDLTLQAPDQLHDTVDADALRSVLVNLVRNAVVHGATPGRVEVLLAREDGTVTLQVSDDGPGIAAAERERVFERFYRSAQAATSGSGLGLAIVRRAAQRLRASVRLTEGLHGAGVAVVLHWAAAGDPAQGDVSPSTTPRGP